MIIQLKCNLNFLSLSLSLSLSHSLSLWCTREREVQGNLLHYITFVYMFPVRMQVKPRRKEDVTLCEMM